jgi:hypothetical protein
MTDETELLKRLLPEMIGDIWTSERMYGDLEALCALGVRFAGTEGERRARELVTRRLHELGLQRVQPWEFEYLGWRRGDLSLDLLSPEPRSLPAIALVGCPNTPGAGLEAEVLDLGGGSLGEFQARAADIPGKIVAVSSAGLPGQRPAHRREKYGWAVERGAAGFLYINHLPGMPALTGSLRPGRLGEIPAASLGHEEGMELTRLVGERPTRARLRTRNEWGPARAQHVFGDIPGRTDELVLLSAHYDGHDISPSALDNGSGVAVVLELARLLAPHAGRFRRTIRVALWTVEEWGVYGSARYADSLSPEELHQLALVVNLDVTSGMGPLVWSLNGFGALRPLFERYAREMGYEYALDEEVTAGSDHFSFAMRGVPAVWLRGATPAERSSRRFMLTPLDTPEKVSRRDMKEAAMVAAQVVMRAATEPGPLAPHHSIEETQEILRAQGLEESLRAQGKWPE